MNSLLGVLGTLFFMFLILAATVEVILELFRGTLERFGITWAKGKVSLDDSLKLASDSTFAILRGAGKRAAEQKGRDGHRTGCEVDQDFSRPVHDDRPCSQHPAAAASVPARVA